MLAHIGPNMGHILILWVHQIGQYSMINSIGLPALNHRLLILELYLGRIYLKLLHTILQRRIIITLSSHSNHRLVEIACELVYFLCTVPIRINWDEYGLDVKKLGLRGFADFLEGPGEFHEGVGADVGAVAEAEVNEVVLAGEVLVGDGLAVCAD